MDDDVAVNEEISLPTYKYHEPGCSRPSRVSDSHRLKKRPGILKYNRTERWVVKRRKY